MIACPKCKSGKMTHSQGSECDMCGTHECEISCDMCGWEGSFDDLMQDKLPGGDIK